MSTILDFKINCPTRRSAWFLALLGSTLLSSSLAQAADVTFERLLKPEPHNWLMVHHDYSAQRHSALNQINSSNIKNLKLKFAVAIGGASPNEALEATPLVEDGFMYMVDGWGAVYKIDVRSGDSGRTLWKMDPGQEKYGRHRGVALWGSEPKRQGQYYHTLPIFMTSLGRVSDLSAKIAAAKLIAW